MCPGVVGVDPLRQRRERPLHPREIGQLLVAHPGRLVTDQDAVYQSPGHLAGIGDVAGLDLHPQLGHQLAIGLVPVAEHLTSGLHDAAVG